MSKVSSLQRERMKRIAAEMASTLGEQSAEAMVSAVCRAIFSVRDLLELEDEQMRHIFMIIAFELMNDGMTEEDLHHAITSASIFKRLTELAEGEKE